VVLKCYRTLGLRDDVIDYLFAAGPTDISYLTLQKARALGIDCDTFLKPAGKSRK